MHALIPRDCDHRAAKRLGTPEVTAIGPFGAPSAAAAYRDATLPETLPDGGPLWVVVKLLAPAKR